MTNGKRIGSVTGALAAILTASAAVQAAPSFMVVSDVDDTVKMTHVLDREDMVFRGFFSHDTFAGMGFLYTTLEATGGNAPVFVSGSPKFMGAFVQATLDEGRFPSDRRLFLKNSLTDDTPAFKIQTISALLQSTPPELKVILPGDDGEQDPETMAEIRARFPDRVAAIYIHRIQGRPIPAGEIAYDLASEVALYELKAERLTELQAEAVANETIREALADGDRLALPESYCPRTGMPGASDLLRRDLGTTMLGQRALSAARQAEALLRKTCDERASGGRSSETLAIVE